MYAYRIRNIKSFVDSGYIDIKPITIFVGKNSCGKSSLLRFPVVLNQTFMASNESPIVFCGNLLDYGNYEDVVFGRKQEPIVFDVSCQIDRLFLARQLLRYDTVGTVKKKKPVFPNISIGTLSVKINKRARKMVVESVKVLLDGIETAEFNIIERSKTIRIARLINGDSFAEKEMIFDVKHLAFNTFFPYFDFEEVLKQIFSECCLSDAVSKSNRFDVMRNLNREEPELSSGEIKAKQIIDTIQLISAVMNNIWNALYEESNASTYIGPFRENPSRVYRDSEIQNRNVGVHGENVSTILIRDYQKKSELIKRVSEWLHSTMGYKLTLKDMGSGFYQIMLVNDSKIRSNIMDVGYGVSQVLPIVTQIIGGTTLKSRDRYGNLVNDSYIYIEQPEIHLHPAAQAELAVLFAQSVSDNKHLVIETHSEHFIRKLQVMIADKSNPLTNEMVKIYYIDKNEQGIASAREMRILDNGRFEKAWPSGFFDKAHELSMELMEKLSE